MVLPPCVVWFPHSHLASSLFAVWEVGQGRGWGREGGGVGEGEGWETEREWGAKVLSVDECSTASCVCIKEESCGTLRDRILVGCSSKWASLSRPVKLHNWHLLWGAGIRSEAQYFFIFFKLDRLIIWLSTFSAGRSLILACPPH